MPLQFSSLQFWSWSIDLLRKHRESYVWYCFFNLIMLEKRAQMPKTLQIFSYGSVYSYSRMLYHQHGLCSAELRRTQRFISKCTVMNVFLEMLSFTIASSTTSPSRFVLLLPVGEHELIFRLRVFSENRSKIGKTPRVHESY